MFEECLQLSLDFIGVQCGVVGCSSIELGGFIENDVLPYVGWEPNAVLRDTIARLLLSTHADQFTLGWGDMAVSRAGPPQHQSPSASSSNSASKVSRRQTPSKKASTPKDPTLGANPGGRLPNERGRIVTAVEAIEALDDGRIAWSLQSIEPADCNTSTGAILMVVPSVALRERALGISLHSEEGNTVATFLVDHALYGWDRLQRQSAVKEKYKPHLIASGLRKLRNSHLVTLVYFYDTEQDEIISRYFPHFALPLTEIEKAAQPALMTSLGRASLAEVAATGHCDGTGVGRANQVTEDAISPALDSRNSMLGLSVQKRDFRRFLPLAHYFERKRREGGSFPSVVFDMKEVSRIIHLSPERRLLFQDALHAIFVVHNIPTLRWGALSKLKRVRIRHLLAHAGLCVVLVTVKARDRLRELRLVMSVNDYQRYLNHRQEVTSPREASPTIAGDGGVGAENDTDPDGDAEDEESTGEDVGEDEEEVEDADSEGGEGRSASQENNPAGSRDDADSAPTRYQKEAFSILRIHPSQTVEVQAAHEAEQRHLALTAAYPRLLFNGNESRHQRVLGTYLDRYLKQRGTLVKHHMIIKKSKAFLTVYGPAAQPTLGGDSSSRSPTALEAHSQGLQVVGGDELAAENGSSVGLHPPSHGMPTRFSARHPMLPKGLSAYAVNIVLDVLQQAVPHYAASLNRLATVIDLRALTKRILPFLKEHSYIYTTGCGLRGSKRTGIVVLCRNTSTVKEEGGADAAHPAAPPHTLTEKEKWEVLEAEKSAAESGQPSGGGPEQRVGKICTSDIVLQQLPPMTADMQRSDRTRQLLSVHPSTIRLVNRVLAVRNGHAQHSLQRASRLHVEMWYQLFKLKRSLLQEVTLQELYDNMSLSTYCVVVGLPQGDIGAILSNDTSVIGWSTPLNRLPPSLRGWCGQQGLQPLFTCMHILKDRGLIRCFKELPIADSMSPAEVVFTLSPSCTTTEGYTYGFYASPTTTAASTLYECLRYWVPIWSTISSRHLDVSSILGSNANPSIASLVALQKLMRVDVASLAASVYQNGGRPRARYRIGFSGQSSNFSRLSSDDCRRRDVVGSQQSFSAQGKRRHEVEWRSETHRQKLQRTEINGKSVAMALQSAFHYFSPLQQVQRVVQMVYRSRANHLSIHPFYAFTSTSSLGNPPADQMLSCANGMYNRYINRTLIQLASLCTTLIHVHRSHVTGLNHPMRNGGSTMTSLADTLKKDVEAVFGPSAVATAEVEDVSADQSPAKSHPTGSLSCALQARFEPLLTHLRAKGSGAGGKLGSGSGVCGIVVPERDEATATTGSHPMGLELAMDALRMAVLSDQAHYQTSLTQSLLEGFRVPGLVFRARGRLQKAPSFRRSLRSGDRIPHLSLIQSPSLLPTAALRGALQPCANIALLTSWAREVDALGVILSAGRESAAILTSAISPFPPPDVELSVRHQPTMTQEQWSMPPAAIRQTMTRLLLPDLQWSPLPHVVELERARHGVLEESEGQNRGSPRQKRRRELNTDSRSGRPRFDTANPTHPTTGAEEGREDDDDEDDEDDGYRGKASMATSELYPARSLLGFNDLAYLSNLGTDTAPTAEERHAVQQSIDAIRRGDYARFSAPRRCHGLSSFEGYALHYPSIFHHVDGSRHIFMWHLVLQTLYSYILRVPGIRYTALEARALLNGLISRRALLFALGYLVEQGILSQREETADEDAAVKHGAGDSSQWRPFLHETLRQGTGPNTTLRSGLMHASEVMATPRCSYHPVASFEALRRNLERDLG